MISAFPLLSYAVTGRMSLKAGGYSVKNSGMLGRDGAGRELPNTIAMAERTCTRFLAGRASAWGFRSIAMAGVDVASWGGINVWVYPAYYPGSISFRDD